MHLQCKVALPLLLRAIITAYFVTDSLTQLMNQLCS